MLKAADIESLGWRKIPSVSPWETFKLNNFILSLYPDGEVEIKYYIYFMHGSGVLFKGTIENPERLREVLEELKIL